MDKRVLGFIGTGVMGSSMAGHLLDAGCELHVYNRTKARAQGLIDKGAVWEDSPAVLASKCDVIFSIVGYPKDVEQVYLGEGGVIANAKNSTGRSIESDTASLIGAMSDWSSQIICV